MKMWMWITTSKVAMTRRWEARAMEIQILVKVRIPWWQIWCNIIKIMQIICRRIRINKLTNRCPNPLPRIKPLRAF